MAKPLRRVPIKRLSEANPRWHGYNDGNPRCFVSFDCPIHEDCRVGAIPFSPSMEGGRAPHAGAVWERTGDGFHDLTLTPSIHVLGEKSGPGNCEWHGFVVEGEFTTCPDSA